MAWVLKVKICRISSRGSINRKKSQSIRCRSRSKYQSYQPDLILT